MGMVGRWWRVFAVAALLAAAGMAASVAKFPVSRIDGAAPPQPVDTGSPPPAREYASPAPNGPSQQVPDWVAWALAALAVAAGVVIVVFLARFLVGRMRRPASRFRRRKLSRREPVRPEQVATEVVAAVEAGLYELDELDTDPRRAVIACWVRLEKAAEAAGTTRLAGDTSTDLVLRLLSAHRLSGDVLGTLADLYRRARYAARHEVDGPMRDQARAALTRVRAELIAPAAESSVEAAA